jgi:hypothetical protein
LLHSKRHRIGSRKISNLSWILPVGSPQFGIVGNGF